MSASPGQASRSLLHSPDFLKLWTGQTVSAFGTQVTLLAVPILAAVGLRVSPLEFGLLSTIEFLPFVLLSRVSRRRSSPSRFSGCSGTSTR